MTHTPEIIVSLTSYPARIASVHETINSLLRQSLQPSRVILWLAKTQFPNQLDDLPSELRSMVGEIFNIQWCDKDIKSYKKLIPALEKFPTSVIVTADDDIIYPSDWLKNLYLPYQTSIDKKIIWCHRAHMIRVENGRIMPYKTWYRMCSNTKPSYRVFCTTGGGVLFPPHCFPKMPEEYMELCPTCDDVWFFCLSLLNGYKLSVVPQNMTTLHFNSASQEHALWIENITYKNDQSLKNVLDTYPQVKEKILSQKQEVFDYYDPHKSSKRNTYKNTFCSKFLFYMKRFL